MRLVHTRAELARTPDGPERRAVVMTMGALHEGHLELVRQARGLAEEVVVTIFVNPLQFGPAEDLDAYPRTLTADLAALETLGVDLVFAPNAEEMYPFGPPSVRVDPGPVAQLWEGAVRPGHFGGVLTVVHKLLSITAADVALFGRKDAQQLALIRGMVQDLDLGVEIIEVPIVRDPDGLAMSSRNAYLSTEERNRALALPRALAAGARAGADGADAAGIEETARRELAEAEVECDYLALVDAGTMAPPVEPVSGRRLLIGAIRVGRTRLIDNVPIGTVSGA